MTTRYSYDIGQLGARHYEAISNDRARAGNALHRLLLTAQDSNVQFTSNYAELTTPALDAYHAGGVGLDYTNTSDSIMRRHFDYAQGYFTDEVGLRPLEQGLSDEKRPAIYRDDAAAYAPYDPEPEIRDDAFQTNAAVSADGAPEPYRQLGEDEEPVDGNDDIDNIVTVVKDVPGGIDIEDEKVDTQTAIVAQEEKDRNDQQATSAINASIAAGADTNPNDSESPLDIGVAHFDKKEDPSQQIVLTAQADDTVIEEKIFNGVKVPTIAWRSDRTPCVFKPTVLGDMPASVKCVLTMRRVDDEAGTSEKVLDTTTKTLKTGKNEVVYTLERWYDASWMCKVVEHVKNKDGTGDIQVPFREGFGSHYFFMLTLTCFNGKTSDIRKQDESAARWNRRVYLITPNEFGKTYGNMQHGFLDECDQKQQNDESATAVATEAKQSGAGHGPQPGMKMTDIERKKVLPNPVSASAHGLTAKKPMSDAKRGKKRLMEMTGGCHGNKKCKPCGAATTMKKTNKKKKVAA